MNRGQGCGVAFFLPSLFGGGAERVIVTLANGIADKGEKVDLVLADAAGPYLSEVSSKVSVIDLKSKKVLFALLPLIGYLRWKRPTVLFSSLEYASIIALWAKWLSGGKTKCIIRMPTTMSIAIQHSRSFKIKCIPFLLKRFLWLADAIIAVSKYSAKDLVRFLGIPSSKVCVIYNPVIDDIFFRKSAMELRHPWFSNESISVIVGVGRLSDEKDFPTLIRAFALLRKKSFVKLVILGEGEERARLEELISELGLQDDVCLAGFVENPFPYIKRASVFALSSKWEGLPNALIQAIALGTPSVATDCPGGVSEILKENKNSVLVPVGNVQKFADALLRSLNTKRVVMDRKMTCFHVETVINQYLDLVKTL